MTTITNDWVEHKWTLKMPDGTEYDCKAFVYLTLKEVPDSYHWPPRDTQVADYSLEGFETLPPYPRSHEKEIERQLLQLLEEEYHYD